MALIKCIECEKQISSESDVCPNCGCPTSQSIKSIKNYLKQQYGANFKCKKCGNTTYLCSESHLGYFRYICEKCAEDIKIPFPKCLREKPTYTNKPHCPYCNSTNLKKIGVGSRMISAGTLGLAGSKIGKQWHCNNCKSDF